MSQYRRAHILGGCFFFTVVTHQRHPLFAEQRNVERLREGFRRTMAKHPFRIDAIVILPDHLHSVWRLPDGDSDFSLRWRLIKHYLAAGMPAPTNRRGEKLVWQRRFWEHAIRDEDDWRRHVDYVHYNPVKHGYVSRPEDWPWNSFARARQRGWYASGWGHSAPANLDRVRGAEAPSAHRTVRTGPYTAPHARRIDQSSADQCCASWRHGRSGSCVGQ
jgi:putative transposase